MLKYLFGLFFVWGMNLEKFFQMILFFLCFVFFVEVLNMERLDGFMFDSVSLIMIVLVFWVFNFLGLSMMGGRFYGLYYLNMMILLSFVGLYLFFVVDSFIWFYIMFELVVIPTLFMVVYWGVQPERWRAGVYLIMYTFFGSIPFLFSIIYVFLVSGVESMGMFLFGGGSGSLFIYFSVLLAFFIKLPLYGFHIWLPKAHVEAPIIGSMILAGVLLKLGSYGLLRFISLFSEGFFMYNSYFLMWGLLGSFMVALVTWRQTDMKCFVAYSSVMHMSFLLIGVFSSMGVGKYSVVLMSICHGFVSCCLFFMVNLVYERCGSRSVVVMGGVFIFSVVFYLMWFLCLAMNMGMPPTLNFFSELMLIVSFLSWTKVVFWFVVFLVFQFSGVIGLYYFMGLIHGGYMKTSVVWGMSIREKIVVFLLLIPMLMFYMAWLVF